MESISATFCASSFPLAPVAKTDSTDFKVSSRGTMATTSRRELKQRAVRGFGAVETWVFDLDNTLYPHHLNLWQQVDARIRDYIVGFLNVTPDEALRVQKDYYRRYGTTMRGLMEEHGLD